MARLSTLTLNILHRHRTLLPSSTTQLIQNFAVCSCTKGIPGRHNSTLTHRDATAPNTPLSRYSGLLRHGATLGLAPQLSVAHASTFGYSQGDLFAMGVDPATQDSATLTLMQIIYYNQRQLMSRETWCVDLAARYMENIHHYTGMPWWATIMVGTVGIQTLIRVPLTIHTMRSAGRRSAHQHELMAEVKSLEAQCSDAMLRGRFKSETEMKQYLYGEKQELQRQFYEKYNCHPIGALAPVLVNILMFYSLSFGIRDLLGFSAMDQVRGTYNLYHAAHTSFSNEGALWFPDLSTPDTSRALGMVAGTSIFAIGEMKNLLLGSVKEMSQQRPMSNGEKRMHYFSRGMLRLGAVWMVFLSGYVPSGVALYWATSQLFNLVLTLLFETPTFRRIFNIQKQAHNSDKPFRFMALRIKTKFKKLFRI